ncbi:hypothetical protein HK105_206967 [Polyrhizophydium stewartii]|uniref:Cytochrome b561 domain-containing protein n=1 Tax=Polyrhizophydium stewartii TaxID=2732419 RepID=A0ABR4N1V9_9FUNG
MLLRPLIAAIASIAAVSASSQFCDGTTFCVVGGVDSANNAIITIHSASQGWVGFGTGSRMAGSSMYVAWRNSTGGVVLSPRQASGNILPQISSERIASLVATPSSITTPSWAKISFSFKRPLAGIVTLTSSTSYIYAMSDSAPENPDSASSASFVQHSSTGSIRGLDLTVSLNSSPTTGASGGSSGGPVLTLPSGTTYDMILRTHGIIIIFIARYLKFALGVWWFRLHVFFLLVGTGFLTIAGIIYISLYKTPPHFNTLHEIIGLVVGIAMVLQIILGVVSDRLFDPKRTSTPIQDILHWWIGRIVVVLAIANLFLGLNLYADNYPLDNAFRIALGVLVGVIALAFVAGQFLIGQQHHDASTDDKFHAA